MVDYDYNELKEFEEDYNNQINSNPLYTIDENAVIFTFLRLFHKYLSSVILFLNQYESNVKREYENKLFKEFNEFRKDLYAKNLSYRIIYQLQNEIRHSKIPIYTIKAKRKNYYAPLEAKFYIHKEYLNFGKLKKDKEFQDLEELIDIYEHMQNMNSYLFELTSKILKFELDSRIEYYDFLKSLLDEIYIEGRPCVVNYKQFNESNIKPNINFIDEKFITLIDKVKMYKTVF